MTLGARRFTFSKGYTPALVITAPNGSHTISTDSGNPSYIFFPGLLRRVSRGRRHEPAASLGWRAWRGWSWT